ncbi:MAG: hypothetical protein ACU85E_16655 [Gammaproteobacteria bacterium]
MRAVTAESTTQIILKHEDFTAKSIPLGENADEILSSLDYFPGESPFVFTADLNQDGYKEIFIGSSNHRLCGTAGCPYLLLEGQSKTLIGDFFGTVALTKISVNGYPVIHSISKRDIETTNLHIYVFDGHKYKLVNHALLEAKGINEWSKHLQRTPDQTQ